MESTTVEGAPVAHSLPGKANGNGDSRKNDREETRLLTAAVYTCTVSRWSSPGKILTPTNQIKELSARAHVARELRARALQGLELGI